MQDFKSLESSYFVFLSVLFSLCSLGHGRQENDLPRKKIQPNWTTSFGKPQSMTRQNHVLYSKLWATKLQYDGHAATNKQNTEDVAQM